jgi:hypothetical protein
MKRPSRIIVLLWPYLLLAVGSGFLHHHETVVAAASGSGQVITASDDAPCPACLWLVASAGVIDAAQGVFSETVADLPCGPQHHAPATQTPLPRSRAPPSA